MLDAVVPHEKPEGWQRERVANGQSKVPCDPKGDRTFLSRFRPHLIRNASHDSSDLFPPFLGIILYIDPGQSHSGRRAALRRVASHQHHVSSLLPWSKLRAKTSRITHPTSLFRVSGVATSLFESTSPFEFLTRQLPLRVPTKGVISWILSPREFPPARVSRL